MAEVYVSSKGADLALARGQELNFSDDQLPDQLFSGEMVILIFVEAFQPVGQSNQILTIQWWLLVVFWVLWKRTFYFLMDEPS